MYEYLTYNYQKFLDSNEQKFWALLMWYSNLCPIIRFALHLSQGIQSLFTIFVWSFVPVVEKPKECFNSFDRKIPNRFKLSTQPCLTLLLISNKLETLSSYWMVALVFVWKTFKTLNKFVGNLSSEVQPIDLLYSLSRRL